MVRRTVNWKNFNLPILGILYNDDSIILEMKKVAKIRRGLTVGAEINFYNQSNGYINNFLRKKLPNWELISIRDGE